MLKITKNMSHRMDHCVTYHFQNGSSSLQWTANPDDYDHLQMFNFVRLALLQLQAANRDDSDDLQKNKT